VNKFIFCLGVHGSGHHMTNDILQPILFEDKFNKETYNINFDKKLRSQLNSFYTPYENNKIKSTSTFDFYLKKKISKHMAQILDKGFKRFYYSSSYTFGSPLSVYGMPSIVDIYDVIKEIDNLEIKIIFLNRDIKDCTKSILRREFEKNSLNASFITHLAALEVENSLDFINKLNGEYFELNYSKLISNKNDQIYKLMQFLDLDTMHVNVDGFKYNTSNQKKDKFVDSFFENRIYRYIDNIKK
jgi:hypothetical protein